MAVKIATMITATETHMKEEGTRGSLGEFKNTIMTIGDFYVLTSKLPIKMLLKFYITDVLFW